MSILNTGWLDQWLVIGLFQLTDWWSAIGPTVYRLLMATSSMIMQLDRQLSAADVTEPGDWQREDTPDKSVEMMRCCQADMDQHLRGKLFNVLWNLRHEARRFGEQRPCKVLGVSLSKYTRVSVDAERVEDVGFLWSGGVCGCSSGSVPMLTLTVFAKCLLVWFIQLVAEVPVETAGVRKLFRAQRYIMVQTCQSGKYLAPLISDSLLVFCPDKEQTRWFISVTDTDDDKDSVGD